MRELYVVDVSEDGRHVVLAASKDATKGTHRVRLDARLVAAVRGDLPGHEPTVDLTPKDIQARLRAGESAEQIARTAGVPVTRVERFAGPVAGELARILAAAQETCALRGRRGPSAVPLGAAVTAALGQPGSWSTRREEDGRWRVSVTWDSRGRSREAAWSFDPLGKELTPVDQASAALGHVDTTPPRRTTASRPVTARTPPRPPARKPAGTAVTAKAAPHVSPKAGPKASSKATPRVTPKASSKAAPRPRPAAARPRLRVVTEPPPAARTGADERDGVKGRASVPAWADVLLGTTPGGER